MTWPRRVLSTREPWTPSDNAPEYGAAFLEFWSLYPKRVQKLRAWEAWKAQRPSIDVIREALKWQVHQPGWTKDEGAYVPSAASWIAGRRWEDEPFHCPAPAASPDTTRRLKAIFGDDAD